MTPAVGPFDGLNGIALMSRGPIRMLADPLNDVIRPKISGRSIGLKVFHKGLDAIDVPLVRGDSALRFGPLEELIEQREQRNRTVRPFFATVEHELVEALESGVPIGAKIEPTSVDCDEPGVTVITEPRLRITGNPPTLCSVMTERAERFAKSRR